MTTTRRFNSIDSMGRTYNCPHSSLKEQQLGNQFTYTCDGCQEMGYGSSYSCQPQCDYDLHKACYNAAPKMSHPFFKQGQFVLDKTMSLPKNNNQRLCVACGTSVKGWRYVLTIDNGDTIILHPCCMMMPHQSLRAIHGIVDCAHCEQGNGVKGWVYVEDGVAVHFKCMKDILYKDWQDSRRCYSSSSDGTNTRYNASETQDCDCGSGGGGDGERNERRRRRKRDIFLSGLVSTLKVLDTIGLLDPIKDALSDVLEEFASESWN